MKKSILVIAALGITYAGIAQDKYVTSALTNLNSKNLEDAKADIDKAMSNPETMNKPKALYAKAQIYLAMQATPKYQAAMPYREGMQSLIKLAEVKPEYEKEDVNMVLYYGAVLYYNDGIAAYNDGLKAGENKKEAEAKFNLSTDLMKNVVKIHNLNGGKRFNAAVTKQLDTLTNNAETQMARSAYAENNYEEVIKQINLIKANPIGKTKDNYIILLESYEKYNKANGEKLAAEELAATTEARALYPDDPNIKNMEMNTLMKSGKTNDLVGKMEADIAKDDKNADLNYNLGILYQTMGTPGKDGKMPANAETYLKKAEEKFNRAIALAPENGNYDQALGVLYYNQAVDLNNQSSLITGTSAADDAKYKSLTDKRDVLFNKTIAPYEKAVEIYSKKGANIQGIERDNYHTVLLGLKQIYQLFSKNDKIADINAKLKTLE